MQRSKRKDHDLEFPVSSKKNMHKLGNGGLNSTRSLNTLPEKTIITTKYFNDSRFSL